MNLAVWNTKIEINFFKKERQVMWELAHEFYIADRKQIKSLYIFKKARFQHGRDLLFKALYFIYTNNYVVSRQVDFVLNAFNQKLIYYFYNSNLYIQGSFSSSSVRYFTRN